MVFLSNGEPNAPRKEAAPGSFHTLPALIFTPRIAGILFALLSVIIAAGELHAQSWTASAHPGILATMWKWLPLILFGTLNVRFAGDALNVTGQLGGFSLNILVSVLVMLAGTMLGIALGFALVSKMALLRRIATALTQFFRNTPWLVLLFFASFLLPFQFRMFGFTMPFPDWCKAAIALSFPITANIAEVTRGAILSIPLSQWESAESLALSRAQTFRLVILPQCIKRMTPPWMNWYAILTMESSLISIVGVNEAMTMTHDALAAEGRNELLIPMYGLLLLLFFAYCYPIARWTQALERRFAVLS